MAWNKGQGHKRLFVAHFSLDSLKVWPSRGIHSCLSGYLNIEKYACMSQSRQRKAFSSISLRHHAIYRAVWTLAKSILHIMTTTTTSGVYTLNLNYNSKETGLPPCYHQIRSHNSGMQKMCLRTLTRCFYNAKDIRLLFYYFKVHSGFRFFFFFNNDLALLSVTNM